jgi:hypothetical protein
MATIRDMVESASIIYLPTSHSELAYSLIALLIIVVHLVLTIIHWILILIHLLSSIVHHHLWVLLKLSIVCHLALTTLVVAVMALVTMFAASWLA